MAASTSETTCPTTGRYTTMRDSTAFFDELQGSCLELGGVLLGHDPILLEEVGWNETQGASVSDGYRVLCFEKDASYVPLVQSRLDR